MNPHTDDDMSTITAGRSTICFHSTPPDNKLRGHTITNGSFYFEDAIRSGNQAGKYPYLVIRLYIGLHGVQRLAATGGA